MRRTFGSRMRVKARLSLKPSVVDRNWISSGPSCAFRPAFCSLLGRAAIVEPVDIDVENARRLPETTGADTVHALLVLLDLLERHPENGAEFALAHAEHRPAHTQAGADVHIDAVQRTFHRSGSDIMSSRNRLRAARFRSFDVRELRYARRARKSEKCNPRFSYLTSLRQESQQQKRRADRRRRRRPESRLPSRGKRYRKIRVKHGLLPKRGRGDLASKTVDDRGDAGIRDPHERKPQLDRPKARLGVMLVGAGRRPEPRVIGHVEKPARHARRPRRRRPFRRGRSPRNR